MNEQKGNNKNRTTGTLARRLHPDELPGWWGKTLEVPADRQAVTVWDDHTDVLKPRSYTFAGLGRSRPDDIALVYDGPITLRPTIGGLLSADDQLLEAEFQVQAQVTDPARFYTAVARGYEELTLGELSAMVAAEVEKRLQNLARRYTTDVLCQDDSVASKVAGDLRGFVAAYLEPLGVAVRGLRHVTFRRAEDAVKRAEVLAQLRSRLRESQIKERLGAVQSRADFIDAVEQIAHEQDLRDLFRQEEWEMLAGQVWDEEFAAAGESAVANGRQAAASLDEKLAVLEDQLVARFEILLRKVGYETPEEHTHLQAIEDTIKDLERWITVLRSLGMFIIFGTALITFFMPEFFPDDRLPRIITSMAGLILALLSFASALWLHGQVKGHRHTLRTAKSQKEVKPAQRQAAERLVRTRVTGALQQVDSNLEQAWLRAYEGAARDMATQLRKLRNKTRDLQEEIENANYVASTYLTQDKIPTGQLQAMLEIDEGLLTRTDVLTQASQELYRKAGEDNLENLKPDIKSLEDSLQDLRTQFIQRIALVRG